MASLPKLIHALTLLIVIGLLAAAPTNAAQDNLIDASGAGNLSQVKALLTETACIFRPVIHRFRTLRTSSPKHLSSLRPYWG